MTFAVSSLLVYLLAQSGATAVSRDIAEDEQARLETCLVTMETDPVAAYDEGLAWLGAGSRPKARHCVALALVAMGEPAEGAAQLETLANAPDGGSLEARAVYLAQAGNAWLAAGYPDAAEVALSNAMKLDAYDASLFKDRAVARIALENWSGAESDLNEALSISPSDAEGHTLRARARLGQEALDAALEDVETARSLDPTNIEILVLRGDIREAKRLAE
ncbi:MAG: hypothetical protein AAFQ21_05870 [Pseudomonadota bacterium]